VNPTADTSFFTVYAPAGLVRFSAGCIACDDRPACAVHHCIRPAQLGVVHLDAHTCVPIYRRGLVWHFSTETELAAWQARHPPGHAGSWSLRVLAPPPEPTAS